MSISISKIVAFLFALCLSLSAFAGPPVVWSGTTAKFLPSGLQSAGLCSLSATGVVATTAVTNHNFILGGGGGSLSFLSCGAGTVPQGASAADPTCTVTPTLGVAGTSTGTMGLSGSTSGTVTIQPQAAAGTYNFNLPTTAGAASAPLLSGGGGSTPMTYGSRSGNTTTFGTTSGSLTSGNCAKFDANGNIVDNGSACSGGSGGFTSWTKTDGLLTYTGFGTVSRNTCFTRTEGDSVHYRCVVQIGTPTNVAATFTLGGNTIDTTKVPGANANGGSMTASDRVGEYTNLKNSGTESDLSSTKNAKGEVFYSSGIGSTALGISCDGYNSSYQTQTATACGFATSDRLFLDFLIPVI